MNPPASVTAPTPQPPGSPGAPDVDPRRWLALAVVVCAQLMIVIDSFIVNIALPSAQSDLRFSTADRQWVLTAYSLTFGGLLLLGGRIADRFGRKKVFTIGLIGFAAASALGGAAPDAATLFGARALQGAFAALLAPAALSIITTTFTEPRERARAFGVYGAVAGGGAAIGLILGGVLTQYASWRWCLLINTPIAVVTALAARRVIRESRGSGRTRFDIPGALLITLGLGGTVFGFAEASTDGWSSPQTLTGIIGGLVGIGAFVVTQTRSTHPLLPLRVVLDRDRAGSFLVAFLSGAGLFAMFLFLTFYFQQTLQYSPIRAGIAFIPFCLGLVASAGVCSQLLPRTGPKIPMVVGLVVAGAGLVYLTRIGADPSWWAHVLPGELLISIGFGQAFVPLASTALIGVHDDDAGVASALVNSTQQIGGSVGIALLSTVAAGATTRYLTRHGPGAAVAATLSGYHHAFLWGAGGLALAALAALALLTGGQDDLPDPDTALTADEALAVLSEI